MEKEVKVFYENIGRLFATSSAATISLMGELIFMTEENSPEIDFDRHSRTALAEELDYSTITISRALKELKAYGVIANKIDNDGAVINNNFVLNPLMFWHGDIHERQNAIEKYQHYFQFSK